MSGHTVLIVASFVLRDEGRGASIGELWSHIIARGILSIELRQRLDRMMRGVLFKCTILWTYTRGSEDIPLEASRVRVAVELTDVPRIPISRVARRGSLMDAIFGTA